MTTTVTEDWTYTATWLEQDGGVLYSPQQSPGTSDWTDVIVVEWLFFACYVQIPTLSLPSGAVDLGFSWTSAAQPDLPDSYYGAGYGAGYGGPATATTDIPAPPADTWGTDSYATTPALWPDGLPQYLSGPSTGGSGSGQTYTGTGEVLTGGYVYDFNLEVSDSDISLGDLQPIYWTHSYSVTTDDGGGGDGGGSGPASGTIVLGTRTAGFARA